jgi:GTPase involved in cell partitioning and DNA repair
LCNKCKRHIEKQRVLLKLIKWVKEKDVLPLAERFDKINEQLLVFLKWLQDTEWRGVSSEVLEEFQEKFKELLKEVESQNAES